MPTCIFFCVVNTNQALLLVITFHLEKMKKSTNATILSYKKQTRLDRLSSSVNVDKSLSRTA